MTTFGDRLRQLREQKKLTQTDLAKRMGMKTYTTVSKWESNENMPKGRDLKFLAEFFNVTSDYLLGISANDTSDKPSIVTIYDQLNDQNKKETYEFAKQKLDEQKNVVPFGLPIKEETNKALRTLAAHSDNPNRAYTEEELEKIDTYLEKEKRKYMKTWEKYNKK